MHLCALCSSTPAQRNPWKSSCLILGVLGPVWDRTNMSSGRGQQSWDSSLCSAKLHKERIRATFKAMSNWVCTGKRATLKWRNYKKLCNKKRVETEDWMSGVWNQPWAELRSVLSIRQPNSVAEVADGLCQLHSPGFYWCISCTYTCVQSRWECYNLLRCISFSVLPSLLSCCPDGGLDSL